MTPEPIPRCPVGVIQFQGRTLTYAPFNHGYEVRVFGSGEPVGCTPELRAAIEADVAKRQAKEAAA